MKSEPSDEYFERRFHIELRNVRASAFDALEPVGLHGPDKCSHHQVPLSRILPLHSRIPLPVMRPLFWQALYLTTLLHQAVHHHAREQENNWLHNFGTHPLPLVSVGLGCWRVARPSLLLEKLGENATMISDVKEYLEGKAKTLVIQSMIDPCDLSGRLLSDKDVGGEHPIEAAVTEIFRGW